MESTLKYDYSKFTDYDIHLFREGKHFKLWEKFGAFVLDEPDHTGVYFAVWAPNAKTVHVTGTFNNWDKQQLPLKVRDDGSGIWEGVVTSALPGDLYKFIILGANNEIYEKADPYARRSEPAPGTASVIWDNSYTWNDNVWMVKRKPFGFNKPMSTYEVHLGSWGRQPDNPEGFLSYRELAETLVPYVKEMGFTHVELMPVSEHPFYGSWGYQTTGYFAPTSRYGTPQDLMYLIECFHKEHIGVLLDWVPSHFPDDGHGLIFFDGTHLYEHEDKRKGFHPDWNSYIFNYGRFEVKSFLISSALYWLECFHIDGLRVDAVASMLYLDYSRKEGEWLPNIYGGNENLEAIQFLKELNERLYTEIPSTLTIAEESTSWPKVSKPTYDGGLGFGMKWMMGWMHDTLNYFKEEPFYRKYHQDKLTFSMWYAFSENFVLSLSHDEVVHGKSSLINKMPGDEWFKFANLRLMYGYMFTHSFPKLIFMGGEFGQKKEWNHDQSLDWHLLEHTSHKGLQQFVKDLNHLYTGEKSMHENDYKQEGFEWIDLNHRDDCILIWKRQGKNANDHLVIVGNFDQQTHIDFAVPVFQRNHYVELLNSDAEKYYGSGLLNTGLLKPDTNEETITDEDGNTTTVKKHSLKITIPPLSLIVLKPVLKLRRSKP
ncbi:MAG TPA: 1,4-alpha-glucan branching protein GlgB [Chitinophagales bacterium]|nr:1,4-alpha-glucan branching protein GlgB [Chitinophagales bacterium]HRG87127.1 1,4-alpha-glucan branching protein GlgB [Chitinophagales bacterium]